MVAIVVIDHDKPLLMTASPKPGLIDHATRAAFHEAGHTVVALGSGMFRLMPGGTVSIRTTNDEGGGVDLEWDGPGDGDPRAIDHERCVIAGAGMAAELKLYEDRGEDVTEEIMECLRNEAVDDLGKVLAAFGPNRFYDFVNDARVRLETGENWERTHRLAAALLEKETLTATEALAVLG